MNNHLIRVAVALPFIGISLFLAGCGTQPGHPNQINSFDGESYDTLTLAHGALTSLQSDVAVQYPKYKPMFNQAAATYGTAFAGYATFRTQPTTQAAAAVEIANLTVAIIALENALQTDIQPAPAKVASIQQKAKKMRAAAVHAGLTVSDILTELEIAAAVARTIPAASPYAALAQLVIDSASNAIAAETALVGQPIDLSLIQPVAAIP